MNLNFKFPNYRSLSPAEVTWANNFERVTGWQLAGTQSVKDSASFWKMAETNVKKFTDWALQTETAIAIPDNREKNAPRKGKDSASTEPKLPLGDTLPADSSPAKTDE